MNLSIDLDTMPLWRLIVLCLLLRAGRSKEAA